MKANRSKKLCLGISMIVLPLTWEEFSLSIDETVFMSATPGVYESENSDQIVEQIIRPTGLIDPEIEIYPTTGQIDHLYSEIIKAAAENERVIVTTLTKRMAEDLTDYLLQINQ